MFDPDFNPYDELMVHKHNIDELIKGMNHYSHHLRELARQHEALTMLIAKQQQQIDQLQQRLPPENH